MTGSTSPTLETEWGRLQRACLAALDAAPPLSAISHLTAAELHGLPLPATHEEPVHVMLATAKRRLRRRGIREHHGAQRRRIIRADGIRVTDLADTWADCASLLAERDLVALGDAIAARGGLDALRAVTRARTKEGARHARFMRRAVERIRVGSASRMESVARLAFVDGGLPEPELNVNILDAEGDWIACVDFLWRAARLVVEYQSEAHHADPRQRARDEERRRDLEAAGYRVVFITAATVLDARKAERLVQQLAGYLAA